ncbi:family 43 glycosylhydrolase [Rothia nasimurium]|uniref:family 43 glycosylhydrolase n=1 Tax=Rothia nasimurium TaxID=85336 RepID=UPI001F02C8C1|nr:family 43 glycosylhydrolase [Rothia nasimurium]
MFSVASSYHALKRVAAATLAGGLLALSAAPAANAAGYTGPWFVPDKPYATTAQWVPGNTITVGELADPDVFQENGTYYAYGTTAGGRNVPLITSTDLKNWTTNKQYRPYPFVQMDNGSTQLIQNGGDPWYNDTLAVPGSWAKRQPASYQCNANTSGCYEIWAPSVEKLSNGKYVMAYVAVNRYDGNAIGQQCIGLAVSDKPTGPFIDTSSQPVQCGSDPKGALDPDLFRDANGKLYMYWKNEGTPTTRTNFWVQEVSADGKRLVTSAQKMGLETQALKTTTEATKWRWFETWEMPLIENPSMVKYGGSYYMFYSASEYSTNKYRTGYAKCSSPTGPCTRVQNTPIMSTDASQNMFGPGGASAFVDKNGALRVAYAAWLSVNGQGAADYNHCLNSTKVSYFEYALSDKRCSMSNQRFFHVATVERDSNGMMAVSRKSEFVPTLGRASTQLSFNDVKSTDMFATEITWLARTGITTGWSDGTYKPVTPIERGAMAAFMYRLAGSPQFNAPSTPSFSDVHRDHPFYKEIEWMKAAGITRGNPDGTFDPQGRVSREAMAAFIYRASGQPAHSGTTGFTDMHMTGFKKEISWFKTQGIATGWEDGSFRPQDPVNRDAMAAFMYRFTQKGPMIGYP